MKDTLNYLQEVLGIREVLLEGVGLSESDETQSSKLILASSSEGAVLSKPQLANEFIYEYSPGEVFSFKQAPPFLVLHCESENRWSIFEEPQRELFQRMLGALKIPPGERLALEVKSSQVSEILSDLNQKIKKPIRILVLTRDPSTVPEEKVGLHLVYQTFSPALMIEKPGLKKPAWEIMQKFRG